MGTETGLLEGQRRLKSPTVVCQGLLCSAYTICSFSFSTPDTINHDFSSGRFLRTLEPENHGFSGLVLILYHIMQRGTGTQVDIIKGLTVWLELFYQLKPLNKMSLLVVNFSQQRIQRPSMSYCYCYWSQKNVSFAPSSLLQCPKKLPMSCEIVCDDEGVNDRCQHCVDHSLLSCSGPQWLEYRQFTGVSLSLAFVLDTLTVES